MKDAAVSSENKMDANKKREITFDDDSDSEFVYKAWFTRLNFLIKILLSVMRCMPSKLFQRRHGTKSLRTTAIQKALVLLTHLNYIDMRTEYIL